MDTPATILDRATRVAAGATRSRYDGVSMTLHWTVVVLVLALFALGETWGFAARPVRFYLIAAHMTLGVLLGLAVIARIAWRMMPGHRVEPAVTGWTETWARITHWALYALLIVQSLFGWVVRWSEGAAMNFFGLLIPSPLTPVSRVTHEQLQYLHGKLGWAIVLLAIGHAGAALYHHFVLRDAVLARMLPRGRSDPAH
jgi:cytochrome b561